MPNYKISKHAFLKLALFSSYVLLTLMLVYSFLADVQLFRYDFFGNLLLGFGLVQLLVKPYTFLKKIDNQTRAKQSTKIESIVPVFNFGEFIFSLVVVYVGLYLIIFSLEDHIILPFIVAMPISTLDLSFNKIIS